MHILVTVDTEADNQWKSEKTTLKNIAVVPRFQSLCEEYEIIPTYFITYEVAADPFASAYFKGLQDLNKAEVGAHLHPWTNPPFFDEEKKLRKQPFPSELSLSVLREKIKALTDIIESNVQRRPVSFRAGRWGLNGDVIQVLEEEGYIADTSITPKVSWDEVLKEKLQLDFRASGIFPYKISPGNIFEKSPNGKIWEIPMSILSTGLFSKETQFTNRFSLHPAGISKKILNKIFFRYRWCRIFPETRPEDLRSVVASALENNLPGLIFMIHSSELMTGGSIYSKTEKDTENIFKNLKSFFLFLQEKHVKGISMRDYVSMLNSTM